MAISIDFLSNVSGFLRGTRDASGALDEVADALDDLAADGRTAGEQAGSRLASGLDGGTSDAKRAIDGVGEKLDGLSATDGPSRAGQELGSEVKSGGADAERSVDSLEAKFRDLAAASERTSTSTGTHISGGVKKGTEEASEGVETLKENTGSNLKEVAASFDGTWQGAASGAQGLIAEIAEGFGPVGLIAGAVAAGGLGLILSGIEGDQEATDELKQHVADLAGQFLDTGLTGKRSLSQMVDAVKDLAGSTDGVDLTTIWDDAKKAGLDYKGTVAAIVSGNSEQLGKELAAVKLVQAGYKAQADQLTTSRLPITSTLKSQQDAVGKVVDKLTAAKKEADLAAKAQEAAAKAGLTDLALKAKAVGQVQGAYSDAAGEVDDYTHKESGLLDTSKYIRAMEKRQEALEDYEETLATAKLSPQARDYIEGLGGEQAAILIAGYAKATDKQKEKLNSIWTAAGNENATSYRDALGDRLRGSTVKGPSIIPGSTLAYTNSVKAAQREAQQYLKDHPLQAGAIAYTSYGKPLY